jgi:hypothetical protein
MLNDALSDKAVSIDISFPEIFHLNSKTWNCIDGVIYIKIAHFVSIRLQTWLFRQVSDTGSAQDNLI